MLVKDLFYTFSHLDDEVVGPVEGETIDEDKSNIRHEFVYITVVGILRIWIRLRGIGRIDFALNGRKVHRMFDNRQIMRDIESHNVHGFQERRGILQLLQRTNARLAKFELRHADS